MKLCFPKDSVSFSTQHIATRCYVESTHRLDQVRYGNIQCSGGMDGGSDCRVSYKIDGHISFWVCRCEVVSWRWKIDFACGIEMSSIFTPLETILSRIQYKTMFLSHCCYPVNYLSTLCLQFTRGILMKNIFSSCREQIITKQLLTEPP